LGGLALLRSFYSDLRYFGAALIALLDNYRPLDRTGSYQQKMRVVVAVVFLAAWCVSSSMSTATNVLHHARTLEKLAFNQRMSYGRADPPPADLTAAVASAVPVVDPASKDSRSDDSKTLQALIYLTHGHLDAAHDIVQRLWTPDAVYTHALLHRLEGEHYGEANMRGWSNADYWHDQQEGPHPMHAQVRELVVGNADDALAALAAASPRVQSFRATCEAKPLWAPYAFLNLCIEGVRQQDVACVRFCEHVTAAEVRLLVEACCARLQIAV